MKSMILATFLSFSFLFSSFSFAQTESDQSFVLEIPHELSVVLVSDRYLAALSDAKKNQSQRQLKLSRIAKFQLSGKDFFEFFLEAQTTKTNLQTKPAGSIVVSYVHGATGTIEIESAYFKPAADGPGGGASVGNN